MCVLPPHPPEWQAARGARGRSCCSEGDLCSSFRAEGKKTIMVPGEGDICQQIFHLTAAENFLTNFACKVYPSPCVFIPQQTGATLQ